MITNIEEAQREFNIAVEEVHAEMGDEVGIDDIAHDMVSGIAMQCDKATALELCRREFGFVPDDVLRFFKTQ